MPKKKVRFVPKMHSVPKFTIGCDPELMLVDSKGNLVSAIPIIKGTKEEPTILDDIGMVSHDNVMLEYGTKPASSEDDFVEINRKVLKRISEMLPDSVRMIVRASANYPDSQLNCDEARIFGCDPDFDAYEFEMNEMPMDAPMSNFRTCGGHIHIGNEKVAEDIELLCDVAKAFDAFLAIPMMLVTKDPTSSERRKLYGKAGAHRPKDYGVEYRSIDATWVSCPHLVRLVYKLCRDGLSAVLNRHFAGIDKDKIKGAVNYGNINEAVGIFNDFVMPLLNADTIDYYNRALNLPRQDLYESWGL